ncbi:hypothetical protein GGS26DRAFT_51191 [Hypomontagnella submonticulosa]|nr:hypothetical protein GGS26DRAFT_51191 [Hypomontagnella submonticulosa]
MLAAFTMSCVFRILSGVCSLTIATVLILLRTLDDVSRTACIVAYVIWGLCFLVFFWLQLKLVPSRLTHRKKLLASLLILTYSLAYDVVGTYSVWLWRPSIFPLQYRRIPKMSSTVSQHMPPSFSLYAAVLCHSFLRDMALEKAYR